MLPLPFFEDIRLQFQVWSFSPPEDVLYERDPTLAQRMLNVRPLSAVEYRTTREDQPMAGLLTHETTYYHDDIDMADAGPSTAPPHATGPRSFLDDD